MFDSSLQLYSALVAIDTHIFTFFMQSVLIFYLIWQADSMNCIKHTHCRLCIK